MKIAVIGATGAVGRQMIEELAESPLDGFELGLFASPRSAGQMLEFRGTKQKVKEFSIAELSGYEYALMSAGGKFSKEHARALADAGTVVIDNSSAWRMDPEVPLVVPEVNGDVLKNGEHRIIANPNCSTIQMVVSLKPLRDRFGLDLVIVSTYQSVSGTGQAGIEELASQVKSELRLEQTEPKVYPQPISFNVLPVIGPFDEGGNSEEELKMVNETKKIFSDQSIDVLATTVRVPVFSCHSESVVVRLKNPVTKSEVENAFKEGEGLVYVSESEPANIPTSKLIVGKQETYVSRVRTGEGGLVEGDGASKWVQYWNVADNLKKGAATNAVQILTALVGV